VLLGAIAVAVVATAFVEVRAPQFAILRTLGASRATIGLLTLVETGLTAAVVAAVTVAAGALSAHLNPNSFNQIHEITLTHLTVPLSIYATTAAMTLAVGLVSGFFPALKAYRAVQ
jgi:putative ABC transport system permease protein